MHVCDHPRGTVRDH